MYYCWDCKRFLKTERGSDRHKEYFDDHLVTTLSNAEYETLSNPPRVQGLRMSRGLVGALIRPDSAGHLSPPNDLTFEKIRAALRKRPKDESPE